MNASSIMEVVITTAKTQKEVSGVSVMMATSLTVMDTLVKVP